MNSKTNNVREFKAESKKLLNLMINSIYTNKEIFLRELISNASDAIDKLHFKYLTDTTIKSDFAIKIEIDKEKRILKIIDSGIGMTKEELDNNLGTIAKSGSLDFKNQNKENAQNIIGQFGVGFYSAFMVAEKVVVVSKAYGSDKAFRWSSSGVSGYSIEETEKDFIGTTITLTIKEDDENNKYSEFLEEYNIKRLVKKYSDYIKYPIKMECEHKKLKEGKKEGDEDAYETYKNLETLNSITPIWDKNKKDLKDQEINNFYKDKFKEFEDPLKVIFYKTEGTATFSSILFIPKTTPFNYYTKDFKKELQLYSNGILIMENCKELLPDYFNFIKGMVDSKDLPLNISREFLQQNKNLNIIARNLERKVSNELALWQKNNRKEYEEFFSKFGISLKYGIYSSYGANKDNLKDLLLFKSSFEDKYVTLKEYIERMKTDQKEIYYACGESIEKINSLPQIDFLKDKGYEVLYFMNDIDEFAIKMLMEYDGKKFKNISSDEIELNTKEEKNEIEKEQQEHKSLFETMKKALEGKVEEVKISSKLKKFAVCLSTAGEISLDMEKTLNNMPTENKISSHKVLEINKNHKIFEKLLKLEKQDQEKLKLYSKLLYEQAALMQGISPKNPANFCMSTIDIMAE